MRVRWTRTALDNLDGLAGYIERENPPAAARMIERIHSAIQNLAAHPSMGKPGRVPGTRELVVAGTPFIVPYRVRESTIEILRVFHASRRWPDDF